MIAGEESGDLHASHLARSLRERHPDLRLFGAGGRRMEEAGVRLEANLVEKAVVGFTEVLRNLPEFKRIFSELLKRCEEEKPDAVILIDYPGFNLRFAKAAKRLGIRVIYYISPQIWAWGGWRIPMIRKVVDQMIVVFPFEALFYKRHGIHAHSVGHPLLDLVREIPDTEKETLRKDLSLPKNTTLIGLLPGSREKEVSVLFPLMLQAARLIQKEMPHTHFLVFQAPTLPKELYPTFKGDSFPVSFVKDADYRYRNLIDFSLVASGTATLENAILGKPMVILYKVSPLTYLIARRLIQIPYVGLVNVVAGEKLVPECLQYEATPHRVAETALRFLKDSGKLGWMRRELLQIRGKLGEPGGVSRAADAILTGLTPKIL